MLYIKNIIISLMHLFIVSTLTVIIVKFLFDYIFPQIGKDIGDVGNGVFWIIVPMLFLAFIVVPYFSIRISILLLTKMLNSIDKQVITYYSTAIFFISVIVSSVFSNISEVNFADWILLILVSLLYSAIFFGFNWVAINKRYINNYF